jgi:D-alanine-D-alanine ligase-like ATP-grasp enzyme
MLKDMEIDWGRADFLQVDNELIFLEINPNGQWVFLDSQNSIGLVSKVADYIMHGSTH